MDKTLVPNMSIIQRFHCALTEIFIYIRDRPVEAKGWIESFGFATVLQKV